MIVQLVEKCTARKMYKAMIHLHNVIKDDYKTPIKVLMQMTSNQPDAFIQDLLFKYLEQLFNGYVLVSGDVIPHNKLINLKKELLNFIFFQPTEDTNLDLRFPHLMALLKISCKKMFSLLSLVFADVSPTSPWLKFVDSHFGEESNASPSQSIRRKTTLSTPPIQVISREKIFEICSFIFADEKKTGWPALQEMVEYYIFLLRFCGKSDVAMPSIDLVHKIIFTICENPYYSKEEKNMIQEYMIGVLHRFTAIEYKPDAENQGKFLSLDKILAACEKALLYVII